MIEIIQAGQAGKTQSLIEMHKLRKTIFKDRMGWDVDISSDGLEIDEYDLPETIYIIARNDLDNRAVGVWRMLPTSSPSMIRDIWPDFLTNFHMDVKDSIWEVSRFGVYIPETTSAEYMKNVNKVTAEMIVALLKLCQLSGISHVYTMYNLQIARSVRKVGFDAELVSEPYLVDGKRSVVGRISMDQVKLKRVQAITGIDVPLTYDDLPPTLQNKVVEHVNSKNSIKTNSVYA